MVKLVINLSCIQLSIAPAGYRQLDSNDLACVYPVSKSKEDAFYNRNNNINTLIPY